jgi:CHAT domain-containing protein
LQVVPYQYRSNYDQKVHNWTKVALNETLENQPLNLVKIFNYLEDSRIALHSRDINLDKWFEETDDALLKRLHIIQDRLSKHKQSPIKSNEPYPLLVTWFERLQRLLPTFEIADIQGKLRPAEIIIQPFFDDILESWRLLCLDQHGLQLIDFNEKINFDEISLQWDKQLKISRQQTQRRDCQTRELPNLKAILENKTVQTVAEFLCDLAQQKGLQRLTVIFPAPLNQFPWEAVSNKLAQYLVREISIQHWLDQHFSSTVAQPSYWLTADPSGEAQCMVKEIDWIGHFLKQSVAKPCPDRYELLKQLQTSHHLHFATHGVFEINNPFESRLILDSSKKQHISLWLLSLLKTHADVIILSACESCLTGKETHGLINPVGLAPTLASMGAKTVIGTLWACDGLAAWFFNYFFYKFAQDFPQESYHLILNRTREKLKFLSGSELSDIADAEDLYDAKNSYKDLCRRSVLSYQNETFPFEHPYFWAGFVMLGETQR